MKESTLSTELEAPCSYRASSCPAGIPLLNSNSDPILKEGEGNSTVENFLEVNMCRASCPVFSVHLNTDFTRKPDSNQDIVLTQPTLKHHTESKLILCLFEMSQAKIKARLSNNVRPASTVPSTLSWGKKKIKKNISIKAMNAHSCNLQYFRDGAAALVWRLTQCQPQTWDQSSD